MKKPRAAAVVGPDEIVFLERDSRTAIPVSQILEVTYDNQSRRHSEDLGCYGEGCLIAPIVFLALLPFKSTDHYVGTVWQDNEMRETIFQVGKGEYVDFLARLREVTGKEWRNLPVERERFRRAGVSAKLDNDVWIMGRPVAAGNYKLVLVRHNEDADSGSGDLYFFSGKKIKSPVNRTDANQEPRVFPVDYAPAQGDRSDRAEISYIRLDDPAAAGRGLYGISEIRLPDIFIRMPEARDHVRRFMADGAFVLDRDVPTFEKNGARIVSNVEYEGREALRFPVKHKHIADCRGFLYVTRDRIAYDPYYSWMYRKDAFDVLRADVEIDRNEIVTPDRTYHFSVSASEKVFWVFFELALDDFDAVIAEFKRATLP